jgi:TIR domain
VRLILPESIYLANVKERDEVQRQIAEDLNKFHDVENEYVDQVFLEMEVDENSNWRQESGLLITNTRNVSPDAANRLWAEKHFRLFLSHKSEVKRDTAALKESLEKYGVAAFVAHEDILPTKAWQEEIENALATMDGFVALMTAGFHDSNWTDQEVGYALARGVPIVAVRLERDPYGFLGKFQGLATNWAGAPEEIVKLLIKNDRMLSAYTKPCAVARTSTTATRSRVSYPVLKH